MSTQHTSRESCQCEECGVVCQSKDHLVDHLSDEHNAFDWIVDGRPMDGGRQ